MANILGPFPQLFDYTIFRQVKGYKNFEIRFISTLHGPEIQLMTIPYLSGSSHTGATHSTLPFYFDPGHMTDSEIIKKIDSLLVLS